VLATILIGGGLLLVLTLGLYPGWQLRPLRALLAQLRELQRRVAHQEQLGSRLSPAPLTLYLQGELPRLPC